MVQEQQELYEQMRGEYLSLVASVEHTMTCLLVEWLDVKDHRDEFSRWFIAAPIPFNYKLTLFDRIFRKRFEGNTTVSLAESLAQLRTLVDFRNLLAHSFRQWNGTLTAKGKQIPANRVAFDTLQDNLERMRAFEAHVYALFELEIQGVIPPISADDFADWPL